MSRSSRLRAPLAALAASALCASGWAAAPASARWADAQLASVHNERLEQADGGTTAVDLSADGRWVVFQSTATNFFADDDADAPGTMRRGGVFRFDRVSGKVELVADGDLLDEESGELRRRGATAPSVSGDGRWVVFQSAQSLVPQDANDNIDVYVRDMSVPLSADRAGGGAYRLVSARDGGDQPASYEPRPEPLPGRNPGAGVYPGQAISDDGRYVAFRTTEQASDLPDLAALESPPGNVFVRDLQAKRTVLVSRAFDGTGAGGSLAPVVLSADGTTVSWVGERAPSQTRMIEGESLDPGQRYYLWRRWDEGGSATRRLTGLADPDDPGCLPGMAIESNPIALGPCYGALAGNDSGFGDISSRAPALSADGWTVAFLSGSGARPAEDVDLFLDAYVTSMRAGVTRKAGTRVVTRGTTAPNPVANGEIESVALSADGHRLLLVTGRRQFLPPSPPLIGEPRATPGSSELYVVDLAGGGTRRALRPGGSGDVDGAVDANPALSADGRAIAFVSHATNLVNGDANQQADAFVVQEVEEPPNAAPPRGLGQDAINDQIVSVDDELLLRASSRRDGSLLLRVTVPVAGSLEASARTRPASRAARRKAARRGRRVAAPRRVASARARAARRVTVRVTLRLKGRELRAVKRGTPLPVRVTVTFRPTAGGRSRTTTAAARFRMLRVTRRVTRKVTRRSVNRPTRSVR